MNLNTLLASRDRVNEQARLANTAFAYVTLQRYAHVVERAGLCGWVQLQQPHPEEERYAAALSGATVNQAVLDEHFDEDDVAALADAVAFSLGSPCLDVRLRIERLEHDFVPALAGVLKRAGVVLGPVQQSESSDAANSQAQESDV